MARFIFIFSLPNVILFQNKENFYSSFQHNSESSKLQQLIFFPLPDLPENSFF